MRVSRPLVAATLTAIGLPAIAAADLLFDGSEFQINTYTTSAQYGLAARTVARSPDGSFIVVWASRASQDGDRSSVHGQRYDSAGARAGTEFQINSYTTSYQGSPAVAATADGGFVVVWASSGQDGSDSSVQGQRYDSAGAAVGTEFQVNSYTTSYQGSPMVAAADGGFVVVWASSGQDGSASSVHGQRYDSAGAAVGTEFQVNSYTTGFQRFAAVAAAAAGGFVVVWTSGPGYAYPVPSYPSQDGSDRGVFGQRYDSTGAAVGTEFQVNSYTTFAQSSAAVATAPDGSFVVVWTSYGQDGDRAGVHGRRYDSAGAAVGTEFQVNSYTTSYQGFPAVAVAADGSFAVVWNSFGQDSDESSIRTQHYDSAGAAAGIEFRVNSYTTYSQSSPAVAAAAGSFVVVWTSNTGSDYYTGQDGSYDGIFGQLLCIDDNGNSICDSQETARACGDTADGEGITTTDVLFVLRAIVGLSTCQPCVGDADGSGSITVSDALRMLFATVGQNVELLCPPCV